MSEIKKIVVDLDNTITLDPDEKIDYSQKLPNKEVIAKLASMKRLGYTILIFTSRNMNTYEGNVGKINVETLPIIMDWLQKHNVPFDEILVGKPWCGRDGFYVDDRSIRPSEFVNLSLKKILEIFRE